MVALINIVVWFLAANATALKRAPKNTNPFAQALSSLQNIEFQELGAA